MEIREVGIGPTVAPVESGRGKAAAKPMDAPEQSTQFENTVREKVQLDKETHGGSAYTPEERREETSRREAYLEQLEGGTKSLTVARQERDRNKVEEKIKEGNETAPDYYEKRGQVLDRREEGIEPSTFEKTMVRNEEFSRKQEFLDQAREMRAEAQSERLSSTLERVAEQKNELRQEDAVREEGTRELRSELGGDLEPVAAEDAPQISTSRLSSDQFSVLLKQQTDSVEYFSDKGYVSIYDDEMQRSLGPDNPAELERFLDDLQQLRDQQNLRSLEQGRRTVERSGNKEIGGSLDFEV